MKFQLAVLSLPLAYASIPDTNHDWHPPVDGDFRGPCPMMNTLANHGYLPRDGRNITRDNAILALNNGLNFDTTLGGIMWDNAIVANPDTNATFFTLDNLNRHNVLEHDASLSRSDAYFGNNHVFNQTIFDQSRSVWSPNATDLLDAKQLANSKIYRMVQSRAANPEYRFTSTTEAFSLGEVSAPIIVFGDMTAGTVNRTFVEYFFENERLPAELGWERKVDAVTLAQISTMSELVANATSLLTASVAVTVDRRRDLHAGYINY